MAFQLRIFEISFLVLAYLTTRKTTTINAIEIQNCNFEDTVDLTNAHRFDNGSYLYVNELITTDRVGIYDYDEVFDGKRILREPHPRGCICKEGQMNCIKFCCHHPVREHISRKTRQCVEFKNDLTYNPYHTVLLTNGSSLKSDITKDFLLIQGIPCDNAYPLNLMTKNLDKWNLFENGSLSLFSGEVVVRRRDFCMMFAPPKDGKQLILTPMLCPVRVVNEEPVLHIVLSLADIISTIFITVTLVIYALTPEFQTLQGKCLMGFLASLALGSVILSLISLPHVVYPAFICGLMGYASYYCFVASFCFLNVICYDIFKNLKEQRVTMDEKKQFAIYSGYACGLPLILTLLLIILQSTNLRDSYKAGIGADYCWFNPTNWSAMIYYFGINGLLLCLDASFYLVVFLTLKSSLKAQPDAKDILQSKKNAEKYGVLILILAITCFFDSITNIQSVTQSDAETLFFYISSILSALYGFIIFATFGFEPLKTWRRHQKYIHKGYALEDETENKDFENIEIATKDFSQVDTSA